MRALTFRATLAPGLLGQLMGCTRRPIRDVKLFRPGELLRAVDRRQDIPYGGRARTLAVLRVTDIWIPAPPLVGDEVTLEGFVGRTPEYAATVLGRMYEHQELGRIGFSYVALAAPRLPRFEGHDLLPKTAMYVQWGIARDLTPLKGRRLSEADTQRRKELRELQRLAAEELLLWPEAHTLACRHLNVAPIELWRGPRAKQRTPRDEDARAVVDEHGLGVGGLDASQAAEHLAGVRTLGVRCGGMREGGSHLTTPQDSGPTPAKPRQPELFPEEGDRAL